MCTHPWNYHHKRGNGSCPHPQIFLMSLCYPSPLHLRLQTLICFLSSLYISFHFLEFYMNGIVPCVLFSVCLPLLSIMTWRFTYAAEWTFRLLILLLSSIPFYRYKFELFWCTRVGQKIRNSKNNNASQRPARHLEGPHARQVEAGYCHQGEDSVGQIPDPVPSPAWWGGVWKAQVASQGFMSESFFSGSWLAFCNHVLSFGDRDHSVMGAAQSESQAWGMP